MKSVEANSPHASRSVRWWSTILLFIMGATWGLQFALLKIAAGDGLNEFGILAVSLLLLAPLYLIALVLRGEFFRPTRNHVVFFLIAGLLGYVFPLGAAVHAAEHIPAGLMALIGSLTPVVTVVLAIGLKTERVSVLRCAAVVLGITAATIIVWADLDLPGRDANFWILIAFIAPLAYGLDGIYVSVRWPEDLSTLQVVTGETLVASLTLLPLYLVSGTWISFAGSWTDGHWALVVFVLVSLIEVFLFYYLIHTAGAVLVSFGAIVSLVAGIFWGGVFFAEQLNGVAWVAVGLLIAALFCVTFGANDEEVKGDDAA